MLLLHVKKNGILLIKIIYYINTNTNYASVNKYTVLDLTGKMLVNIEKKD
jgi:hypothetical protein